MKLKRFNEYYNNYDRSSMPLPKVVSDLFNDLMDNYEIYTSFRQDFIDYHGIDLWEDLSEEELMVNIEVPSAGDQMNYDHIKNFIKEKYDINIDNTPSAFLDIVYINSKLNNKFSNRVKGLSKNDIRK